MRNSGGSGSFERRWREGGEDGDGDGAEEADLERVSR